MQSTISRNKREGAFFMKTACYIAKNPASFYRIPYANRTVRKAAKRKYPQFKMSEIETFWWPSTPT